MSLKRSNAHCVANPLSEVQELDNDFGKGEFQEEPRYENVIVARHPRTKLREWVEGEAIESFERKALKTVPWVKIAKSI